MLFLAAGIMTAVLGNSRKILTYAADKPSSIYIDGKEVAVPDTWTKETIREMIKNAEKSGTSASSDGKTAGSERSGTAQEKSNIGWIASGSSWIYYKEDGTALRDTVTPDGYYVGADGKWTPRTMTLLEESFALPEKFRGSKSVGSMASNLEPLERLNKKIREKIGANRVFYVYDDSIRYYQGTSDQGTFLMGLFKNPADSGWQLKLAVRLNKSANQTAEETCDYAVLRFLIGQVSHVPERVSEAVYESWQGSNSYGITTKTPVVVGDTAITYSVEEGAGVYILTKP